MTGEINIDKLQYVYGEGRAKGKPAIRDISLTIEKGEFLVVLGHNGSGKSTLAKHLNAIYLPTGGKVYVDGLDTSDLTRLWEIRRKSGLVFQNPDNQIVSTIVEEDVAFGPENLGLEPKEIKHRVEEALKAVGMENYRKHSPHLLSGGQKQRVAIAGIIAMRPDYLILDEPTAMLDPQGRKEVVDTLVKLNKEEGLTIVLITHFVEEAILAERVVVIEEGQTVLEGPPREVFQKVEVLKNLRLDVPQITELAYSLKREGFDIADNILTVNEMVEQLCRLR